MNIFGIGGAELVLIIFIMLIVAGPKRMIRWAYVIGRYVGKFRILWEQVVDMMQDEVDAAGLDVKLPKEIPTRATIARTATELMKPYTAELERSVDEVRNPVKATIESTNQTLKDAQKATRAGTDEALGAWSAAMDEEPESKTPTKPARPPAPKADGFGSWSQQNEADQPAEREA